MTVRSFDHLLHYCELPIKRAIPLALSLMYIYCKNFVQSYHLCQFCLYYSLNFSIFDHCHFQTVFHTNVNYCHPFFYSSMKLPFIPLIWTFHIVNHFIHCHWCWPNHSHSVSIQWFRFLLEVLVQYVIMKVGVLYNYPHHHPCPLILFSGRTLSFIR